MSATHAGLGHSPMSPHIARYYDLKANIKHNLEAEGRDPRCVLITSLDLPEKGVYPNVTCETSLDAAAGFIAGRTHRVATPEEVDRFYAEQRKRSDACAVESMRNRQQSVTMLTPELAAQMGMIQRPVEPASEEPPDKRTKRG